MAFRTNTGKASEGATLKPEGDYEIIIETAETSVTLNGKKNIKFKYTIRNDVEQPFKDGVIFHSIWMKSSDKQNEDDRSIGGFNYAQLMAVVEAANLPDGKEYATLEDLLDELVGKPVKVRLYHDDYNGKSYEKIARHMPTGFPKVQHKGKKAGAAGKPPARAAAAQYTAPVVQQAAGEANDDYPF